MGKVKNKLIDWKDRLKDRHMFSIVITLIVVIVILSALIYKRQRTFRQATENGYNMAFYQVTEYVNNTEKYLAKATISNTPENGIENLTYVWREADLAQSYLSRLPISSQELESTQKFLHQVSDYSYSLSRKNIKGESLSQEDLDNISKLHSSSVELANVLNQLSEDINSGRIKWGELEKKGSETLSQEVSNISKLSFGSIEENFHEYEGLIYDGAYSNHMTNPDRVGLTGEDVTQEIAVQKVHDFIGTENIQEVNFREFSENADIPSYYFDVTLNSNKTLTNKDSQIATISISQKGGHVINMNYDRTVEMENITQEQANEIGKNFLNLHGFENMKETYYLKQGGILTINYAYTQNDVVMYPDLVKLKVALDNGEVLGIETLGYLNSHRTDRDISNVKITKEQAKENLNKNLEIKSEGLAIIPTKWATEVLCYEFKGLSNDTEFLVYINAETGKEQDILVIVNTPDGTLTM